MRNETSKWSFLIVIGVGLVLSLPLFWCGFPDPTHDGRFHAQWVECFSRQFWNGELFPRWLTSPNSGFGAATFFFYAPIPYFVGAIIWGISSLLGVTPFALGWTAALGLVLSGLTALHCLRRYTKTEWVAVLGGILYMIAPYHLAIDLLDRGANAEFWAFVWLPWIVSCEEDLAHLAKQRSTTRTTLIHVGRPTIEETRKIFMLGLAIGGLLATHLPTAVTFAPVVVGLALCHGRRTGFLTVMAAFLAICLSAAYIFPAYAYRPYTNGASIGWFSGEEIGKTVFFPSLNLGEPLFNDDPYNRRLLFIAIHFAIIWVIALAVTLVIKNNYKAPSNVIFWSVVLYGCFIMMSPVALPIYEHVAALRHIQFSWRFMACATLASTVLTSVIIQEFCSKQSYSPLKYNMGRMAALVMLISFVGASLIQGTSKYSEAFLREDGEIRDPMPVNMTAPNGYGEHDPVRANLNEARVYFPNAGKEVLAPKFLEGNGIISLVSAAPRCWKMDVNCNTKSVLIIPQYWFPGWIAKDSDGKHMPVICNLKSGLVEIEIPSGHRSLVVTMQMLWPEIIGDLLSIFTILTVGITLFWSKRYVGARAQRVILP